jgi:5-methylcytosine-specific restriction endonuclease McrA
MAQRDAYASVAWRRLRLQVLQRDGYLCQIRLAGCTRAATSVDHIYPVHMAPELALEDSNCRSACRHCNSVLGARYGNKLRGRGNKLKRAAIGFTSSQDDWD